MNTASTAATPAASGLNPLDAGVVRIAANLADGLVVASDVRADRPRGLAAALGRHRAAAIPDLARRLFALCGTSHSVAATRALAMAGADLAVPSSETVLRWLAAERVTAHLQATFMGWIAAVPLTPTEAPALSRALAAVRNGDGLIEALSALGLSSPIPSDAWAGRLLAAAGDGGGGLMAPDPLTAADDERVLAALDEQGEAFAAAPCLPGRRPETGPAARAARLGLRTVSPAERLGARLAEIGMAARILAGLERPNPADWIAAGQLGPGTGFCAVETPRGRLHHLARLSPDGTVSRYLILAPTEWNFAAGGPFATALQGLRIGDTAARPAIERLASLYDPCVGCAIEVRQLAPEPDPENGR